MAGFGPEVDLLPLGCGEDLRNVYGLFGARSCTAFDLLHGDAIVRIRVEVAGERRIGQRLAPHG